MSTKWSAPTINGETPKLEEIPAEFHNIRNGTPPYDKWSRMVEKSLFYYVYPRCLRVKDGIDEITALSHVLKAMRTGDDDWHGIIASGFLASLWFDWIDVDDPWDNQFDTRPELVEALR